jgi:hypothetical protein
VNPTVNRSLNVICAWLEQTPLSHAIQVTNWIIPTVQTIHILAIAVVASSALMMNLRLIGVFGTDQPLKAVASRFLPFIWWALPVLLATGAILIIAEPARSLKNPAFQLKMALVIAAIIVTGFFQILLKSDLMLSDSGAERRVAAATIAVLSMLLWSGIIFAGRWIAYYA